ncbi:ROK family protein [Rhizobium rhizogenes]|uniref:ROK family protein n=1 Tax=Rhizobium rhizogenes TaxID=359 RepID=UPI001574E23C|nr:ROK family protein [Rhizobium rhizogenes]
MSVNTDVIDVCIMDFAGRVLAEANVQLRERIVAQALEQARNWVHDQQGALALSNERFFGVGLGIAGFHISGTSFNASLPLHEWSLIELGPLLTSYFDRPVWALNGGKTGTIAEAMFGAGRHIGDFAYLSFNYGFGVVSSAMANSCMAAMATPANSRRCTMKRRSPADRHFSSSWKS